MYIGYLRETGACKCKGGSFYYCNRYRNKGKEKIDAV